jgi:hypothetical protein
MRYKHLVLCLLLLTASACRGASPQPSVESAARALNSQSKTSLGVSIQALSFLYAATPGTYLAEGGLNANNSWPYLAELERAGYATINKSHPDIVQIELTSKGRELLDALHGP